jgi:hypothetical protein
MKGYVDGQISTTSSSITTANTNMKGYVDGQISTTGSSITTANTNMKGYVDSVANIGYERIEDINPAGLGDLDYIITTWRRQ